MVKELHTPWGSLPLTERCARAVDSASRGDSLPAAGATPAGRRTTDGHFDDLRADASRQSEPRPDGRINSPKARREADLEAAPGAPPGAGAAINVSLSDAAAALLAIVAAGRHELPETFARRAVTEAVAAEADKLGLQTCADLEATLKPEERPPP